MKLEFFRCLPGFSLLFVVVMSSPVPADTAAVVEAGEQRLERSQRTQRRADKIDDETRDLADEYQQRLRVVNGLKRYNELLNRQLQAQDLEIATLKSSIADAAVVERQVLPLLERMIDTLDKFIAADMPFLIPERHGRVSKLRELLVRSDISAAEKCRRVFEAYQIENDYGRSIEAYRARLDRGGTTFDADILRVGRVALLYRRIGSDATGFWNTAERVWVERESNTFRRHVERGLKVAAKEVAPELITIPLMPVARDD